MSKVEKRRLWITITAAVAVAVLIFRRFVFQYPDLVLIGIFVIWLAWICFDAKLEDKQ